MRTFVSLAFLLLSFGYVMASRSYSTGMTEDRLDSVLMKHEHFIMDPPLLANLQHESGKPRIVSLFLAIKYEKELEVLEHHEPLIRDAIIKLMNTKNAAFLSTLRGQRIVIYQLTQLLRKIMYIEEGEPLVDGIEFIELIIE